MPAGAVAGKEVVLSTDFDVERLGNIRLLRLRSSDGTNRLTRACILALIETIEEMAQDPQPLVLTGNGKFFSAGADLNEIALLTGPDAYEFSKMGQRLMNAVERFPAPIYAAISGFCMGGGLDFVLACHRRIASPNAVFGHRGASLGLITGWGGTQRLPRLIGRTNALQMFVAAEKIDTREALRIGLVDAVADDPLAEAIRSLATLAHPTSD
jgi:enoyl-CoA hydratase/carnithine racemase